MDIECEVETAGRTVLCYLPFFTLDNADPAIVAYTPPTKRETLEAQDSLTSQWLLEVLGEDIKFRVLAEKEGAAILARDTEDGSKLQRGIELAIQKGVLTKQDPAPRYTRVDVVGKSADEVAGVIHGAVASGPEGWKGGVVALVGLSGTGKGTTMDKLKQLLPQSTTWSNGNVFRSLTLLAVTHAMHQGQDFDSSFLTPENLEAWMAMLQFGQFDGRFDIRVQGLGHDFFVSQVANTTLKGPMVGRNIPTVAEVSQGEVVLFASKACQEMAQAGVSVLLEGREPTVNYIETPHRFELVLSDPTLIGKRRAAQIVAAKALEKLGKNADDPAVDAAVASAVDSLVAPIPDDKQ